MMMRTMTTTMMIMVVVWWWYWTVSRPAVSLTCVDFIAQLGSYYGSAAVVQSLRHGLVQCDGVNQDGVVQKPAVPVAVTEIHLLFTHTTITPYR